MWNATSCPEAVPRKKNGAITASATHNDTAAAALHSRTVSLAMLLDCCESESLICCAVIVTGRQFFPRCLALAANRCVTAVTSSIRAKDKSAAPHDDKHAPRSAEKSRIGLLCAARALLHSALDSLP